jgi:hypothetical protein
VHTLSTLKLLGISSIASQANASAMLSLPIVIYQVFRVQADCVQGDSEHLLPWQQVIMQSSESVSAMPSTVTEVSFCFALSCVFMAHVRYNLEQRVFIYDCYVKKKIIQFMQENILP